MLPADRSEKFTTRGATPNVGEAEKSATGEEGGDAVPTALKALTLPAPNFPAKEKLQGRLSIGSALSKSRSLTWAAVHVGFCDQMSAATEAESGVAIDVPSIVEI
jgi:hypothetical protein